jgi:plasmid maintenance system antidote protein VapI
LTIAQHLEIPTATFDAIIAGRHPITYDIALRIERSLGIMPELWFILQTRWQRHQDTFQLSALEAVTRRERTSER